MFEIGDLVTAVNDVSNDMMWRAYRVTDMSLDDRLEVVDVLTSDEFILPRRNTRKIKTFQDAGIGDFVLVRQLNSEDNLQPMLVGVKCDDRFDINDRTSIIYRIRAGRTGSSPVNNRIKKGSEYWCLRLAI